MITSFLQCGNTADLHRNRGLLLHRGNAFFSAVSNFIKQCLRHCFSFLSVGALLFFACAAVWAYVTINPEVQKLPVTHGQKLKGYITVSNNTEGTVCIEVQPEDWSKDIHVKTVPWMTLSPKRFVLRPGKSKRVTYKVSIPCDETNRYISQIFFAFQNTSKSKMNFGMRIASLLDLHVLKAGESVQ